MGERCVGLPVVSPGSVSVSNTSFDHLRHRGRLPLKRRAVRGLSPRGLSMQGACHRAGLSVIVSRLTAAVLLSKLGRSLLLFPNTFSGDWMCVHSHWLDA